MQLSNSQKNALRTAILAEAALSALVQARNDPAIANYCNADANPVQKVWKDSMSSSALFDATSLNDYIGRSAAERQAYDLLMSVGTVDPTRASIRNGVVNIFSGPTNSGSRGTILTAMTRNASWLEQKLGGTPQTADTVTAWKAVAYGPISVSEISDLLNGA